MMQVLADVFNAEVYTGATNSASLGAAYRAKHGAACNILYYINYSIYKSFPSYCI